MATSDYDRDRRAQDDPAVRTGMSATSVLLGLIVAAFLVGYVAFNFVDRTPVGTTVTSPPATTLPQSTTPPSNTTTTSPSTPVPTPSTK